MRRLLSSYSFVLFDRNSCFTHSSYHSFANHLGPLSDCCLPWISILYGLHSDTTLLQMRYSKKKGICYTFVNLWFSICTTKYTIQLVVIHLVLQIFSSISLVLVSGDGGMTCLTSVVFLYWFGLALHVNVCLYADLSIQSHPALVTSFWPLPCPRSEPLLSILLVVWCKAIRTHTHTHVTATPGVACPQHSCTLGKKLGHTHTMKWF